MKKEGCIIKHWSTGNSYLASTIEPSPLDIDKIIDSTIKVAVDEAIDIDSLRAREGAHVKETEVFSSEDLARFPMLEVGNLEDRRAKVLATRVRFAQLFEPP